jgi:hypothetical protein
MLRRHSTASNEMHDLEIVAVLDTDLPERRSRNDLKVALDRHPQRIEVQAFDHLGNRDSARHPPVLAVYSNSEAAILS